MNTDIKTDIEGMIAYLESNEVYGTRMKSEHNDLLRTLEYHGWTNGDDVLIFLKNELDEINRAACDMPQELYSGNQEESTAE